MLLLPQQMDSRHHCENRGDLSIQGILGRRAAETGERLAYAFLADGEIESRLDWAGLDARARALSVHLCGLGPHDRPDGQRCAGRKRRLVLGELGPGSPMGLAGRDPIFFSQLETEQAAHPALAPAVDSAGHE